MNVAALLQKTARSFGTSPAVSHGAQLCLTYAALADRVQRLAAGFTGRFGLVQGDRVGIAMTNCPAFTEVLYAIWHAGLVAVPINAKLHQREVSYIIENSGARLCMVNRGLEATVGPLCNVTGLLEDVITADSPEYDQLIRVDPVPLVDVDPADPAWLFYTSGTTGRPKGAVLSHRNLLVMTLSYFADNTRGWVTIIHKMIGNKDDFPIRLICFQALNHRFNEVTDTLATSIGQNHD